MASRVQIIKELRAKGASFKMIDDVALFLKNESSDGYDSPVFVATVEFIIKIKDLLKSVGLKQEQEINVSDLLNKKRIDTEGVNFGAAKSAVEGDEEIPEDVRKKILEHLLQMEMQKDTLVEMNKGKETGQDFDPEGPSSKRKKTQKQAGKTSRPSLLERISKILSAQQTTNRNQQKNQNIQQVNAMQATVQQSQQSQQVQQQQQQQQQAQKQDGGRKESALKANILKALKMSKDKTVFGDNYKKNKVERKNSMLGEPSKNVAGEKQEARKEEKPKEVSNELLMSQAIDKAVKAKTATQETKKPEEKGAFAAKVEEKGGARANEENVAKMKAQEAIEMLKNSGMKPSGTQQADTQLKADLAQQQKAQAEQKQR